MRCVRKPTSVCLLLEELYSLHANPAPISATSSVLWTNRLAVIVVKFNFYFRASPSSSFEVHKQSKNWFTLTHACFWIRWGGGQKHSGWLLWQVCFYIFVCFPHWSEPPSLPQAKLDQSWKSRRHCDHKNNKKRVCACVFWTADKKYLYWASDRCLYVTLAITFDVFLFRMNVQSCLTSVLKISGRTAGRPGPRWGCKWSAWTSRCPTIAPDRTASRCGPGAPSETHIWEWQGGKQSTLIFNILRTRTCFLQEGLLKSDVKPCVCIEEMQHVRIEKPRGRVEVTKEKEKEGEQTHSICLWRLVELAFQMKGK